MEGYNIFTQDLSDNKGRGVLFYIASDIGVSLLNIPSAFQECMFIQLMGRGPNNHLNQLIIGNIYRSPNSTQANDNELCELLHYIQQQFKAPKLIVGDFNFSNIKWYHNQGFGASARCSNLLDNELKFVNVLRENFLIQHVVEPTRQRGLDTPHTLDLIISTDDCLSEIEHLSPLGLSDNSVLKFSYQFYKDNVKTEDKFKLDKGDYVKLRTFLDINWDEVLDVSNNTIDEMWEIFKQIILEGMNNFIPRGSKRLNKKKSYQPFTSELKQLKHKKTPTLE